ncbi:MAG TPA: ABC transporter ATP-binding protein, partial [Anaerovibrio sp.]|nr:ABC transporter ATP-binding protein [Anaerovibrio sp.]
MLLEINDLDITYGDNTPTVENVKLSLNEGEILTIVGESGSGKTTVIRSILGLLSGDGHVSNGTLNFKGRDLKALSQKEWRELRGKDISMIFQDSGNMLNPVQTIGHQFREYIQLHSDMSDSEADAKAVEILKRMHLPNAENILSSYAFELSGGMRQRVGIAMAITFHPQLLLADEPTSALDVTTQAQIVKELMQVVKESGTAMIMVTHNLGVASYMSD